MINPKEFYLKESEKYQQKAEQKRKKYQRLVPLRALLFLSGFAAIFLAFSVSLSLGGIAIIVVIISLALFVTWHQRLEKQRERLLKIKELNDDEILYLKGIFEPANDGSQFLDHAHPYHIDLDIFGHRSVFSFVNRTATRQGEKVLAQWLSFPAPAADIRERQAAIQELSNFPEWRQLFRLEGYESNERSGDIESILQWLQEENELHKHAWVRPVIFILPVITLFIIIFSFINIPSFLAWIAILVHILIIRHFRKIIYKVHIATSEKSEIFLKYKNLLRLTEDKNFNPSYLDELHKKLFSKDISASKYIAKLSAYANDLDLRHNVLGHLLVNLFLFWDLHLVWKLERWRKNVREHAEEWFDAIATIDALNSFAALHFNHPEWCYPEFQQDEFKIEAKGLGHFLIPETKRINNDFSIYGRGKIHLITGSNMAGKSTFLRTVGINIVLAMAGAPVCAEAFKCSVIQLYSSMRNTDSLELNESSFYAELKRLKMILDHVEHDENSFFLIDEILKGTNSMDRHRGSLAMLHQLLKYNGTGLISTHDLELAEQSEHIENVKNFSFEVQIEDEELNFDYTLRPGICRSFNASILMQKMGIEIQGQ